MISLKTACKVAIYGCALTALFASMMALWAIADGNYVAAISDGGMMIIMIGCTIINYGSYNRLA